MGVGVGFSFKFRIFSGGIDIISLIIRKKIGRDVGSIFFIINGIILLFVGFLFGWKYVLYLMVIIFVLSRVIDVIFIK